MTFFSFFFALFEIRSPCSCNCPGTHYVEQRWPEQRSACLCLCWDQRHVPPRLILKLPHQGMGFIMADMCYDTVFSFVPSHTEFLNDLCNTNILYGEVPEGASVKTEKATVLLTEALVL